jgi:hypothetical protein
MTIRPTRLVAAWGCLVVAFTLAGCGGGKAKVKGKVSLNGKPLVWGTVTLVDASGTNYQSTIGLDGTFTTEEAVPTGPVKIGVISPKPPDPARRGGGAAAGKAGGGPSIPDPREEFLKKQGITPQKGDDRPLPAAGAWFPIPEKYNDPNTSGLSDVVKSGQDLTIDLK